MTTKTRIGLFFLISLVGSTRAASAVTISLSGTAVGQTPVYTISGGLTSCGNSTIYWTTWFSPASGGPMQQPSVDLPNGAVNGAGGATISGNSWMPAHAGNWTVRVNVCGQDSPFLDFTVRALTPPTVSLSISPGPNMGSNYSIGTAITVNAAVTSDPDNQAAYTQISGMIFQVCSGKTCSASQTLGNTQTYTYTVQANNAMTQPVGNPQSITITAVNPPKPVISLSQASYNFTATRATSPGPQSLTITNSGPIGTSLNWSVSSNAPGWLSASTGSGALSSGSGQSVSVIVNSAALAPGSYAGTLTFTAPGAPSSVSVSVNLFIVLPDISLSPSTLSFSAMQNTSPGPQSVTTTNSGSAGSTLNWSVSSNAPGWLSASPGSGALSSGSGQNVSVIVNSAFLTPGNYTGALTFAATTAGVAARTVTVNLTVSAPLQITGFGAAQSGITPVASFNYGVTYINLLAATNKPNTSPGLNCSVSGHGLNNQALQASDSANPSYFYFTYGSGSGPALISQNYSFALHCQDASGSGNQTIAFTIKAPAAPAANALSVTTAINTPSAITIAGNDPNSLPLTYAVVSNPAHGTLSALSGNHVTYTPTINFSGSDSFTFKVNNGVQESAPAIVSINVTALPLQITAFGAAQSGITPVASFKYGITYINLLAATNKPNTSPGLNCSVSGHGLNNQALQASDSANPSYFYFTYGSNGAGGAALPAQPYSFPVTCTDASGSDARTISFTINAAGAPSAASQSVTAIFNTPSVITLTGSDPNSLPLSYTVIAYPAHGALSAASGNHVTYTPATGFSGSDGITFKVNNSLLDSAPATINITVSQPTSITPLAIASMTLTDAGNNSLRSPLASGTKAVNIILHTNLSASCTLTGKAGTGSFTNSSPTDLWATLTGLFDSFSDTYTIRCQDQANPGNAANSTLSLSVSIAGNGCFNSASCGDTARFYCSSSGTCQPLPGMTVIMKAPAGPTAIGVGQTGNFAAVAAGPGGSEVPGVGVTIHMDDAPVCRSHNSICYTYRSGAGLGPHTFTIPEAGIHHLTATAYVTDISGAQIPVGQSAGVTLNVVAGLAGSPCTSAAPKCTTGNYCAATAGGSAACRPVPEAAVTMTSPVAGSVFADPAALTVAAQAVDSGAATPAPQFNLTINMDGNPVCQGQGNTCTGSATLAIGLHVVIASATVTDINGIPVEVGQSLPVSIAVNPGSNAGYVPGEIIVKYKDTLTQSPAMLFANHLSFASALASRSNHLDVLTRRFRVRSARVVFGGETRSSNKQGLERIQVLTAPAYTRMEDAVAAYAADPNVEYAEPNYILKGEYTPSDPYYNTKASCGGGSVDLWGLKKIQMDRAWDLATSMGRGITVGVVDSGADRCHPDLAANLNMADGWNFVACPTGLLGGFDQDCEDSHPPIDDYGHGSAVAGTMGAVANSIGVIGVAPNIRILPVKISDAQDSTTLALVAQGVRYAMTRAKVINLSVGGQGRTIGGMLIPSYGAYTLAAAIKEAYDIGVVVVVGAGNDGANVNTYPPANISDPWKPIIVAGTNPDDSKWAGSNFGVTVDVAAPASQILHVKMGGGYECHDGTSFSAPYVSGVAALMLSLDPNLKPDQVRTAIANTADPIKDGMALGIDHRVGRLNAYRALTENGYFVPRNVGPMAQSMDVSAVTAGDPATTVTVSGDNFTPTTVISINGHPESSAYLSPTQMTVVIPADLLRAPQSLQMTAQDPARTTTPTPGSPAPVLQIVPIPQAPQISGLPEFVPTNGSVQIPDQGYSTTYTWTFILLGSTASVPTIPGLRGELSAAAGSGSGGGYTLSTQSASVSLQQLLLPPGRYQMQVTATNLAGRASLPATATITLVPPELSDVVVYPNPWRADQSKVSFVTFGGIPPGSTVKIFTVSGRWIRTVREEGIGQAHWDLANDNGEKVQSGLYLYLLTDPQGGKAHGKFAVIR